MVRLRQAIRAWQDVHRFRLLKRSEKNIVFYAEGGAYAPFLRPILNALPEVTSDRVVYLTSDATDPLLGDPPAHIRSFFVGAGGARTLALNHLNAGVLAMTMPDLNTYHIKRSGFPVHYAYIHHSMVSTHMIYRVGAFDHFDTILCVGPHHVEETRAWEALNGLPEKQLLEHGYAPLDNLFRLAAATAPPPSPADGGLDILLAPSWGSAGIMETRGVEISQALLDAGHFLHVRPHPRTRQLSPRALDDLKRRFAGHPRFDLREDTTKFDTLLSSHIMISDWSGVAMEFAFGLERPVLFLDVPRKINNPQYDRLEIPPLEATYREEVGVVLAPDRIAETPAVVAALQEEAASYTASIRKVRDRCVYNFSSSAVRGAKIIADLAADARH